MTSMGGGFTKMTTQADNKIKFEKLKSILVNNYIHDDIKHYFEHSVTELGSFGGTIYKDFEDDKGKKTNFKDFCAFIKSKSNKSKLYFSLQKKERLLKIS